PAARTGVYCHDLDAFRCLLTPAVEPRPRWRKALARRILHGLQRAAVVFYSTAAVRRAMEQFGLVDPQRLVWAPYGVAPEYTAETPEGHAAVSVPGLEGAPFLLHVGSCIPRKRMDVLFDV